MIKGIRTKTPFRIDYADQEASNALSEALRERLSEKPPSSTTVVVCIGTDRSTGDALGPLVGEGLKQQLPNVHIYGTLERPVHAVNLEETLALMESVVDHPYVIAVDACLGQLSSVGQITVADGALRPGAGVHKKLPPVGHMHITGIVNVGGFMEYFVLQNTRLSVVFQMASVISSGLADALLRPAAPVREPAAMRAPRYPAIRFGSLFKNR